MAGRTAYASGVPAATTRVTMSATWLVPPAMEPGVVPSGVASQPGDAAVDDDREAAEDVGAVPDPGGSHRVGDEGDVVDADEVEDGARPCRRTGARRRR